MVNHIEEKVNNIDAIKVFLTISVVFYHCIMAWSYYGWHDFIVLPFKPLEYFNEFFVKFHTQAFTFLSGYLFYFLKYEKNKYNTPKKDIIHRAKRLLLPYAVMLIWVIPFYFTFEHGTVKTAISKYVLAVAPSQLWYLVMLFGVFVIFYFISNFISKHCRLFFFVFYIIFGAAIVMSQIIPDYFQLWTILKYLLYFHFGFATRKGVFRHIWKMHDTRNNAVADTVIYVLLYALLIFIDYKFLLGTDINLLKIISKAIDPFISLIGITAMVKLFAVVCSLNFVNSKFFKVLVRYNFTVYLIHQQLVYIPLAICSTKIHPLLLVIINFVFSLLGSLAISRLLNNFEITRKIFGLKKAEK